MYNDKTLSTQILENFNFEETKRKVKKYFINLERLEWEWTKLNAQKGQIANYDFMVELEKQPYIPIGKDEFDLSTKENIEKELKKYKSGYYWAKRFLSVKEQLYIEEYFINRKFEDDLIDLLDFNYRDSYEFKKLKRSAIYKFASVLNLVVKNLKG